MKYENILLDRKGNYFMKYEFIKSNTVRSYLIEECIELTDYQKAIIIMNTRMNQHDTERYLKELRNNTKDDILCIEIDEYFDYNDKLFKTFKELNKREVFLLEYYDEEDDKAIMLSDNFDHLYEVGKTGMNEEFIIKRYKYDDDDFIGQYVHSPKKDNIYTELNNFEYKFSHEDIYDYFYGKYFRMPHPFKQGDYVRDLITNSIGIYHGPSYDGEFENWWKEPLTDDEKNYSAFDMTSTCEFFDEKDADFGHDHCQVWELEKIYEEDIPEELRNYFKSASYYIKQGIFLEDLFYYQCEYKRNKDKRR